jgi:hypothetical protein
MIAAVERRLAATGLLTIVTHVETQSLEHTNRVHAALREELVRDAWDKERYLQLACPRWYCDQGNIGIGLENGKRARTAAAALEGSAIRKRPL